MATARNRLAAILCHNCGRDYAREYWAFGVGADPYVCNSCRRDTNRDAADAPRWTPGAHADEQSPVIVVSQARKQCRVCRGEWDGLILGPPPSKDAPLPFGICPACGDEDDAKMRALSARVVPLGMPLPELQRPARVTDD